MHPDCGVITFSTVYHPVYFLSRWRKIDDSIGNLSSNLDSTIWGSCVVLGKSLHPSVIPGIKAVPANCLQEDHAHGSLCEAFRSYHGYFLQ